MLDVVRPLFEKLDVLEVMGFAQRAFVEFFEDWARENFVGGAGLFDGVGEEAAHRGGRAGEIGVWEIEADAGGGTADGEAVVDELGQFAEAAAADDLRSVGGCAAVVRPTADFGQALNHSMRRL